MAVDADLDKNWLYGKFTSWDDRKQKLALKAAHKALDIPDEDMNIDASRRGIGALGATCIALAAGLPTALLACLLLLHKDKPDKPADKPPVVAPVDPKKPADTSKDVDVKARMEYEPPAGDDE